LRWPREQQTACVYYDTKRAVPRDAMANVSHGSIATVLTSLVPQTDRQTKLPPIACMGTHTQRY